jgi:hypothetical protein
MMSSQPIARAAGGLFLAGDCPDHAQAQQLGDLNREQTDASGGGMEQNGVARLEPRVGLHHPVDGRQAAHCRCCSRLVGDAVGKLQQGRGRHDSLRRIGAERTAVVAHPVTGRDIGHAFAHRHHFTRSLDPDPAGRLDRVIAGAKVGIGEIAADGMVAEADFARTRLADSNLLEREDFGSAGLVESDGLGHRLFLLIVVVRPDRRGCSLLFSHFMT